MSQPRTLRQRAVAFGQGAATHVWCAALRRARRRWRPGAVTASPAVDNPPGADGPVLAVAPHPDDETAGCAGTLLRHVAAGDPVTVATVTDGRASRAYGLDASTMARTRHGEALAAAAVLGVTLHWCGLREGEWQHDNAVTVLAELLRGVAPRIVYAPSRFDFHPEHRAVAHALAAALEAAHKEAPDAPAPELRIYPIQVPLDVAVINHVVAVGAFETVIRQAIEAHHSQVGSLQPCLRRRRYTAAIFGVDRLGEDFWRMPADLYARLHRRHQRNRIDERRPPARLHALRYLALTDGIVYWRNRHAFQHAALEAHG